jgi:hypothetical protein
VLAVNRAVYLGPDKAGSTWLYDTLRAHPAVCAPRAKELFFFDRYHHLGVGWYESQFQVTDQTKLKLDVSHDYLFHPLAPKRLHAYDPDTLLIVGLREPLSRAVSSYLYMRSQGRTKLSFERAVFEIEELLDHGRYAKWISRWLDYFDREQMRYLVFDDLVADADSAASRLAKSLGLTGVPLRSAGHQNGARAARLPSAVALGRKAAGLIRSRGHPALVQLLKGNPLLSQLLFRDLAEDERVQVSDDLRLSLHRDISVETAELDRLTGLDLSVRWAP